MIKSANQAAAHGVYSKVHKLAITGITAALYFCLTMLIHPFGFGLLQLRVSEVLNLLAFLNPVFAPGIVVGCMFANFFSPLGLIDVLFGGAAQLCAMFCITRSKSLLIASLWPVVFMVFISLELWIVNREPVWLTLPIFMLEEFVVSTLIGFPLFKIALRNRGFANLMQTLKFR